MHTIETALRVWVRNVFIGFEFKTLLGLQMNFAGMMQYDGRSFDLPLPRISDLLRFCPPLLDCWFELSCRLWKLIVWRWMVIKDAQFMHSMCD